MSSGKQYCTIHVYTLKAIAKRSMYKCCPIPQMWVDVCLRESGLALLTLLSCLAARIGKVSKHTVDDESHTSQAQGRNYQ